MAVGIFHRLLLALVICSFCEASEISPLKSSPQLTYVHGVKYPNSLEEGVRPLYSKALSPRDISELGGFNELLPFVTPAPDQEDANSCMLMSLTGVAEWWLHRLTNTTHFIQNGPLDLSERWWMNLSNHWDKTEDINYWFTDAIYLYNTSKAALNRDYPFAKGWYKETEDDIWPVDRFEEGAAYGARYNWIDDTDRVRAPLVELPPLGRKILFKERHENPWAIGKAPKNIVEKVIEAFNQYKSPIQVIYNHEGYWHAVYVIGYDKNMPSYGCPFTTDSLAAFQREADLSHSEGDEVRGRRFERYKRELTQALEKGGGCQPRGMFYVRDSQYSDPSEEIYIYDPTNPAANKPYSKRIVLREFDWIRTMANHVSLIYPAR